jgi:hypothetical protein
MQSGTPRSMRQMLRTLVSSSRTNWAFTSCVGPGLFRIRVVIAAVSRSGMRSCGSCVHLTCRRDWLFASVDHGRPGRSLRSGRWGEVGQGTPFGWRGADPAGVSRDGPALLPLPRAAAGSVNCGLVPLPSRLRSLRVRPVRSSHAAIVAGVTSLLRRSWGWSNIGDRLIRSSARPA